MELAIFSDLRTHSSILEESSRAPAAMLCQSWSVRLLWVIIQWTIITARVLTEYILITPRRIDYVGDSSQKLRGFFSLLIVVIERVASLYTGVIKVLLCRKELHYKRNSYFWLGIEFQLKIYLLKWRSVRALVWFNLILRNFSRF